MQLLDGRMNVSKNDTPLKEWIEANDINPESCIIPNVSYEFTNFEEFYNERKKLLVKRLMDVTNANN